MATNAEIAALARVVKAEARALIRRAENLRRLAAQLEQMTTTETSQEDTDVEDRARSAHAVA